MIARRNRRITTQRADAIRALGWRLRLELGLSFGFGQDNRRATRSALKGQSPLPKGAAKRRERNLPVRMPLLLTRTSINGLPFIAARDAPACCTGRSSDYHHRHRRHL
jgi:hypothetical protein